MGVYMPLATLDAPCFAESKEKFHPRSINMDRVATIILGGGQGTRLFPLTDSRCKPAVCFGGRYRLIDVPISNAINSNCHKIFVLTQFLSSSLHRHILQTYASPHCFIEILAAEQKPNKSQWFQGTADAVRQNLKCFIEAPVDYFLILSGDQLYHMDYRRMVAQAYATDADLVIGALPIDAQAAKRMGVLQVNDRDQITDFAEKPQTERELQEFYCDEELQKKLGIQTNSKESYLGSMGIYLFKRSVLLDLMLDDPREDFGKHLIPSLVKEGNVYAFFHNGYWEDIGTLESFYAANMDLTLPQPSFDCYQEWSPLLALRNHLPGPKIFNTTIQNSIICEGSIIEADRVSHSILGPRSVVKKGTTIEHSYLMGNDFYHPPMKNTGSLPEELHVGTHCTIRRAIFDTNVYVGNGVQLTNKQKLTHYDDEKMGLYIRDGIIVARRGAHIPDGFCL